MAEQTERSCPAPPALRHRSHRFDSVLKAGSASTMEACGKTITPAGLRNVNLHTRLFCLPPTVFHRWRGDAGTGLLWVASQWSTQASLLVSHAAFLYSPCPRPPTLHLLSSAAKTRDTTPAHAARSSAFPSELKRGRKTVHALCK